MSGIYIHIPYCLQACHYCNFHFSTNQKNKATMIEMICQEIALQKDYLSQKSISSIYFGGGTPSLLEINELDKILNEINKYFFVEKSAEITLEANPDDLVKSKLVLLKNSGINRLSIGIQTFDNNQLKYMNRAHNAIQAKKSVSKAQEVGFQNISIDLIYGIPSPDHKIWENDLSKALDLGVQHISSYCLTIEPTTTFGKRRLKGTLLPENEEYNAQQFELLQDTLTTNGFEHYEVSNFCLPTYLSKHNTSYWQDQNYLGVGPGAHSYNGTSRQYNIENNLKYINELIHKKIPFTLENLDTTTKANEYIMTRLRTKWGIDSDYLLKNFGITFESYENTVNKYKKTGLLELENNSIKLTKKGLLFADKITEDLFII